jgi:diamine oxidase
MTPVSSAFLPSGSRAAWFWLAHDREFFILHPLDLQFLVNTTDTDASRWTVMKVYYADQFFSNFEELMTKYREGFINKTRVPYPEGPESELYSSLYLRGEPFPKEDKPPPVSVLPKGNRFTVQGSRVEYMRWHFTLRVSPSVGLHLYDLHFGQERIAYEISMQEIAVLYTGYGPVASTLYFADSAGLFGTRMRGMLEGVDCPPNAVHLDTQLFTSNEGGLKRLTRAVCIFEHNNELALRRHRAYSMTGAFYGGLSDSVLVVRSFISLINYDYILDYTLHQNGAVEVSVSSTGYLATTFYYPPEERYSTRVHKNVAAGLHQHLFHIKADLDVGGVANRFESFNIGVEDKDERALNPEGVTPPSHKQFNMVKQVRRRESEACHKFDFHSPKYLLISGDSVSDLGHRRSYHVLPRGETPALLPADIGFEPSVSWARCQVAVTRHKDSEATSSSVFAMWDARDPVVNFTNYLADNEHIEDEVFSLTFSLLTSQYTSLSTSGFNFFFFFSFFFLIA